MKRYWAALSFIATVVSGSSPCEGNSQDYSFYLKVGTGISSAQSVNVSAPTPPWNAALEGYDSNLGNCAIASFSIGCEWMHAVDLEASISNRSTFEYRKFQTPSAGGSSYTREFDLSVTPILFSANFLAHGVPYLNWNVACGKVYPLIGAGLGVSRLLITNFRTTGLPPNGDSAPMPSFSSENEYTRRCNFTYTVLAGFEYNYNDYWALSTGYRWLDAGHFKGPRYLRVGSGSSVDVGGAEWGMNFRSNEWFIELKIFI